MTDFDIEYAVGRNRLEQLLESVDRPGDFFTSGRLFVPMPTLEVEDVGLLSFPVPDSQVRALVEAAERAPYGKGTDTLVDTSVRDCWQIGAAHVRLGGAAWNETFAKILGAVGAGLGCPAEQLDARFYKLLVYEPGGFFAPHRDTEKADGMIATLSVSLPAAGAGGELIVRHRGREIEIDLNASEPSELAYAAFYADCTHETRPVREGHRLSLVFNLCLRPGDTDTPRRAPDYSERIRDIAEQLVAWREGEEESDKLIWLLEHNYSEAGLSFDALKNADAALAAVLDSAAERADCELHAAILHIEEEGNADYSVSETYRGRHWDDIHVDTEFGEVLYGTYWLDNWGEPGWRPAGIRQDNAQSGRTAAGRSARWRRARRAMGERGDRQRRRDRGTDLSACRARGLAAPEDTGHPRRRGYRWRGCLGGGSDETGSGCRTRVDLPIDRHLEYSPEPP